MPRKDSTKMTSPSNQLVDDPEHENNPPSLNGDGQGSIKGIDVHHEYSKITFHTVLLGKRAGVEQTSCYLIIAAPISETTNQS